MRHLLTRAVVLGAAAWFAAAGATGTVAWRAVSVLNAGGENTGLLSAAEVHSALGDAKARAAASPRAGTTPSPVAVPSASSGPEVARTWAVTGGTVAASCTGDVIALLYATPQDGWTVEVHSSGPRSLEVELHRAEAESRVRASCVAGEPVPDLSDVDDDSDHATAESPAPGPAPAPSATRTSTPTATPTKVTTPSATTSPTPSPSESEDHDEDEHSSPSPSPSPESHR